MQFGKAGYAIRTRLCSPNTLFRFRAPAAKVIQKVSQKLPQIVQNPSKNASRARARIHAEKAATQNAKNAKNYRKRVLQKDQKNVTAAFVLGPFLVPASMDREKRPQVTKMREKGWPKAVKRYKKRTAGRGNELPETCQGTARKLPGGLPHLPASGHTWSQLATAGHIWAHLATSGHIWPHLATTGRCPTLVSDH